MKLGICEVLFIVLLCLQLAGVISISWWLVFLPLIVPISILLVVLAACGAVAVWANERR